MMKQNQQTKKDYYMLDLQHICRSLLHRIWVILLAGLIVGGAAFSFATFMIDPNYSSSILVYVNNKNATDNNSSISSSEITAAQELVKTYGVILESRDTLKKVIEEAELEYTADQLKSMISWGSSNGTQILYVTVTTLDPHEAAEIANAIADVLPGLISETIDGAVPKIVEYAEPNLQKVSPSIARYTAIGLILGVLVSVAVLVVIAVVDDRIHDEEYVFQTYDYPILAKIPDLTGQHSKRYAYYAQRKEK